MPKYTAGGRRDTSGTVRAITEGTRNILQAKMGYAQQLSALGESIGGGIANIGGVIARSKERREQHEFESAMLSQKQTGDLERQREGIQGQKEIEAQKGKGRLELAGEQAQARSEAATTKAKREASKDPNIAYDEGTGTFKSTEMGSRAAATEFNIKRRQKTLLDQRIKQYHTDAANLDKKRMLASENDKRDFDFKMEKHTSSYIQGLHNERRKLVQGGKSELLLGLMGDAPVDPKTPEGVDELLRRSYELEKATAFDYASRTGDDKFIPRSSPEYTEYLQYRKPVTDMLMSMPALQQEGSRRDAGWMQRKANMLGAQLFMMSRNNPRMRAAMEYYQGGGGVGQQPGAGAGAAGGQVPQGDGAGEAGAGGGPR